MQITWRVTISLLQLNHGGNGDNYTSWRILRIGVTYEFLQSCWLSEKGILTYLLLFLFSCWVMSDSFVTPWAVAHQAPLSMGFSRWEYWRGLPFPPPGDLLDPGIELTTPVAPVLSGRFSTTEPPGEPWLISERVSEVTQSCLTLCDPMGQTPPSMGFSGKDTGISCHFLLYGIFPPPGIKLVFPVCSALQLDSLPPWVIGEAPDLSFAHSIWMDCKDYRGRGWRGKDRHCIWGGSYSFHFTRVGVECSGQVGVWFMWWW